MPIFKNNLFASCHRNRSWPILWKIIYHKLVLLELDPCFDFTEKYDLHVRFLCDDFAIKRFKITHSKTCKYTDIVALVFLEEYNYSDVMGLNPMTGLYTRSIISYVVLFLKILYCCFVLKRTLNTFKNHLGIIH